MTWCCSLIALFLSEGHERLKSQVDEANSIIRMKQQMIETLQLQAEHDAMEPSPRHVDEDLMAEFGSPPAMDEQAQDMMASQMAQMAEMEVRERDLSIWSSSDFIKLLLPLESRDGNI